MSAPRDLGRQARVEERADEQLEAVLLAQGQDAVEAAPDAELREELDLREIEAIGYDMDYTLIDYKMVLLEERVYHYSKEHLSAKGFPVSGLTFNHELVVRGLVMDTELGNVLKVDRFGYVRRALHAARTQSGPP